MRNVHSVHELDRILAHRRLRHIKDVEYCVKERDIVEIIRFDTEDSDVTTETVTITQVEGSYVRAKKDDGITTQLSPYTHNEYPNVFGYRILKSPFWDELKREVSERSSTPNFT